MRMLFSSSSLIRIAALSGWIWTLPDVCVTLSNITMYQPGQARHTTTQLTSGLENTQIRAAGTLLLFAAVTGLQNI